MSRAVYVSTNCFSDRTPAGIRRAVAELTLTHVELSAVQADSSAAVELSRDLHRDGVCVLLHNYFPPPAEPFLLNLASCNGKTLRQSREHCARAIELSAELGSPFFAAHAGFGLELPPSLLGRPEAQREFCRMHADSGAALRAREIFRESVADLVSYGSRCGVAFLIENHVASEGLGAEASTALLLGLSSDHILSWSAEIDGFGLLLDMGHLRCTARTMSFELENFCAAVGPIVRAFHLSDNDGRSDEHRPFDRFAWFLDFVATRPGVPATLEFDTSTPGEIVAARALLE